MKSLFSMAFKIQFIEANGCLAGTGCVDNDTTLETAKEKLSEGLIADILSSTLNIFRTFFQCFYF